MLADALELPGPVGHPVPDDPGPPRAPDEVGHGMAARRLRGGDGSVCLIGVGKLLAACEDRRRPSWHSEGIDATVWDPRVVSPPDPVLFADGRGHAWW